MNFFKRSALASLICLIIFLVSGYYLSDDYFFSQLIQENHIRTPEDAFEYLKSHIERAHPTDIPTYGLTPRYMLVERKYLWCDEGSMVLATLVYKLGYETSLVDVKGEDNDNYHTYLEVLEDGQWKNYDTWKKTEGFTHQQILDSNEGIKGYPKSHPYPRWHNIIIQNNFYIKYLVVKLRGTPG